jgi:UDP-sugar transporter A1/2/3
MPTQWISLVLLLIGVALVQLADGEPDKTVGREQNRWIGFGAAISACFLSGFAGIYFEKILKVTSQTALLTRQ